MRSANRSHVAGGYKFGSGGLLKTDLSCSEGIQMSLLLFALLSTALAVPAPCPAHPPIDCGVGYVNCPGPEDHMGCTSVDLCAAEGEECPSHCPWMPTVDCSAMLGEGFHNCPGPVDHMGCSTVDLCAAEGEECPSHCPWMPTIDCSDHHRDEDHHHA